MIRSTDMEKIGSFKITGMAAQGFKCFAERQAFEFGDVSIITGHNGMGKSSIAEAIAYAITGSSFYGEQGLDRLYALGSRDASVELVIEAGGETHRLTRSRTNDATTITYDGVAIRQSDIAAMFGERDVFLSIFNPLYFIEALGDKGRSLLERHLPSVPHEDVLGRIGEGSRKLLEGKGMKSPESLLDGVRADIRDLGDAIIYIDGQRDLLESQARERREAAIRKRAEVDELDVAIGALEKKRAEGLSFGAMEAELDVIYARYDELSHEGPPAHDTKAVDAKIQHAMAALEKRRAGAYASAYAGQLAELGAAVAGLRETYSRESAILAGLRPGIQCPTCKQGVTEQNEASVKKTFSDSIARIKEKGRSLTAQIDEIKALDEKTKAVFEGFRDDDVRKLESELDELRGQRAEIASSADRGAERRRAQMESLKSKMQALELDIRFGNLDPDEGWTLEGHIEGRKKLEAELAALNEAAGGPGAEEKSGDIEGVKKAIKARRELEGAIKHYITERMRLMLEGFSLLNRVDIVLYETVKKTGVVRDVFKFSYDGKPYKFLSLSEKVKAGLEVSELMKRLTGRNYPVFIDNGESVPVIDNVRPSGQALIAQVAKGAPLEVAGAPDSREAAA